MQYSPVRRLKTVFRSSPSEGACRGSCKDTGQNLVWFDFHSRDSKMTIILFYIINIQEVLLL